MIVETNKRIIGGRIVFDHEIFEKKRLIPQDDNKVAPVGEKPVTAQVPLLNKTGGYLPPAPAKKEKAQKKVNMKKEIAKALRGNKD